MHLEEFEEVKKWWRSKVFENYWIILGLSHLELGFDIIISYRIENI